MPSWLPLRTPDDLDEAVQASADQPVMIIKHSRTCGTSAQALDTLGEWLDAERPGLRCYLVTVQADREASTLIAARFGVRHESPQVLVLRGGQVAWHASHFRVSPSAVARALAGWT
ncbi:MAG: bacillithiol system redox-active protein YtxJ [Acidobacteriota bacterium]